MHGSRFLNPYCDFYQWWTAASKLKYILCSPTLLLFRMFLRQQKKRTLKPGVVNVLWGTSWNKFSIIQRTLYMCMSVWCLSPCLNQCVCFNNKLVSQTLYKLIHTYMQSTARSFVPSWLLNEELFSKDIEGQR